MAPILLSARGMDILHHPLDRSRAATRDGAAEHILRAYERYLDAFLEITRRAQDRFLARAWGDGQRDGTERLHVFSYWVRRTVDEVRDALDDAPAVKARYAELSEARADCDVARTFFNSVVRRVLRTRGVNTATDFTAEPGTPLSGDGAPLARRADAEGVTPALFETLFRETGLADAFADLAGDAAACARAAREALGDAADAVREVEWLPFLFYRNKGAYVVARLRAAGDLHPLLVPLSHPAEGVRPDAVLLDRDDVSRVFSFARSYFHADTARPRETVAFLRTLMPLKPIHELYTSIGHHRHGKTELYRALTAQLAHPAARLEPAEGIPGLVMIVFTLPAFNVVFKVIRDRFGAPKDASREQVMERYRFVFARDRVGRLADAQEFEFLQFPRDRFDAGLLDELLSAAAESVWIEGDHVVVRHLYTERRIRPLDLYVRESAPDAAKAAVIEYGNAIRDLACSNIFPGDLLMKNFGVSRHGRVIFYDYDELALLTEMKFRALPSASSHEEEMSAEPFFAVDDRDVFPEQWLPFLVPPGELRTAFLDAHADLLTPAFWREMQRKQARGEIPDFFPYPLTRRLRPDAEGAATAGDGEDAKDAPDSNGASWAGAVDADGAADHRPRVAEPEARADEDDFFEEIGQAEE
ncbi:bifunctional isocitrate dehydrogenase kinase/phosphatase [Longimicrobium sp.]|uniref:bifunctional isocitrate dehydrogenase kinase/phosphatase n=1 Tax=Longimicrobium sp. TaxID=2029185 RepID=UPI002E34BCCD|nr:bifunctional isocitrate dehydrogenase kinase/phosphatase [Longimicrobium sp.]HEX6037730.1 bifunctional isocitrate dehydrogenase kinase/phosphatase [Longimicrobium sp.]